VAFCFLANQLLARERWARERLLAFRGQSFEVHLPFLVPLVLSIDEDGRIIEGDGEPAAVVTLGGVTGASALADELRYLARHLRPDLAEELSKLVGDVAAERIVATGRAFVAWQADAARRIAEAAADFAVAERGVFVRRAELADLAARVAGMAERLERLGERVDRLA